MAQGLPLKECSIHDIYFDNSLVKTYQIPIYQRNYAWDDDQISALVKDVKDSFDKDSTTPYYIGTLVTFRREEGIFEVIDGQQRLTTIFLVLKALGYSDIDRKLTYSSRRISAKTLENLPDVGDEYDYMIKRGFDFAVSAIREYIGEDEIRAFGDYFLNRVIIIHYNVPKDVDLNHYFEVMNSRGEQLEKHEIVKSRLYGILKDDNERMVFARLWDACSTMSNYIQQSLDSPEIFPNNFSDFRPESFEEISLEDRRQKNLSILELMHMPSAAIDESASSPVEDKFQPIIDFPNFLLLVLKLTLLNDGLLVIKDFQLDDKELLGLFEHALSLYKDEESRKDFVRRFSYNLLKARYLLDNFVVHHAPGSIEDSNQNPWLLERYYRLGNDSTPRRLANSDMQPELVHLLSMFEVSFSPKTRKNYLFYILIHLFKSTDLSEYLQFLRRLANKYFFDIYVNSEALNERNQPKPDIFDEILLDGNKVETDVNNKVFGKREAFEDIYRMGSSDISLFVFNYTDYRLWRLYADNLRGERLKEGTGFRVTFFNTLGCSDFGLETFNRFYFSRTRKSLEHFYPQANVRKDNEDSELPTETEINCFGNFAMIGAAANSSGSNWDPIAKCNHYNSMKLDQVSVASLKFKVMMQICADNSKNKELSRPQGLEWVYSDIKEHQEKMLRIILVPQTN